MILHWLELPEETTIYEQLLLEEKILREDSRNFCLINKGTSPAIVMGISGKLNELVDIDRAKAENLLVIKRFSGGGTVVVDNHTLFVTFIFQKELFPFPAYPEKIMKWSETIYQPVFPENFVLKENDYAFKQSKFGGNAQYIRKERWLHHTSFLWDYEESKMNCLLHPRKTPVYRLGRSHKDFLCKLKDILPSQEIFLSKLKQSLARYFEIQLVYKERLIVKEPSRFSTEIIPL